MIYCDASLMVSSLATEPLSSIAREFLSQQSDGTLAISPWVGTEVASALAMKMRRGLLGDAERGILLARWGEIVKVLYNELIGPDHFRLAATLVDAGPRGLRAGDALHLAVAKRAGCALATLDRDLADAAEAVGVEVALRPPG